MILYSSNKIHFLYVFYLFISVTSVSAFESIDYQVIDTLVNDCYKNTKSCNEALIKINNFQKDAAQNKKFSCQTRLLGLEANLIMAMNSNLKRKDSKSIIQAMKKYCY